MYEATFELEAITPLFMRGADQRKAEFRSASVKGVMRWWFRALAGNYLGNSISKLREIEGTIFGSAGSGGARRSRILITVKSQREPGNLLDVNKVEVVTRSRSKQIELVPKYNDVEYLGFPTSYLFFSVKMMLDEFLKVELRELLGGYNLRNGFQNQKQLESLTKSFRERISNRVPTYYPPGSKFEVTLRSFDRTSFILGVSSLWLATAYGGFGFRSKRGAGSLIINQVKGISADPEIEQTIQKIAKLNYKGLATFLDLVGPFIETLRDEESQPESTKIPKYPTLSTMKVLECRKSFHSPLDALRELQSAYAGSYNRHKRKYEGGVRFKFADRKFSHSTVKNLSNGETSREKRYYFGLPVVYANWKIEVIGLGKGKNNSDEEYPRRASSIILTVKKEGHQYRPIIVVFPYEYLPKHEGQFKAHKTGGASREEAIITVKNNEKLFDNEAFVDTFLPQVIKEFKAKDFEEVFSQ
ncbi:CRISPR-associated RAMP Cmr1 [Thermococcus sp. 2319x1]|uniref:type III-B CRISPR module RAMP protein Cmr1 n=1 Tax=Thermococcus sp. 2319x1 TaxID=1674923 RepID=UPI00073AC700|nr:type III-B CRISPR module RAMP protein Cmr1 [Thermococcus sp. 2319x1]ALV63527.1 CRISPR-associated RAMP Cmr1 [Thermococcus sp. 2319x1]